MDRLCGQIYTHTVMALCWLIRPVDPQKYSVYSGPPPLTDFVQWHVKCGEFGKR